MTTCSGVHYEFAGRRVCQTWASSCPDLAPAVEDRTPYWRSVLRGLGARPATCSSCGGSGTVNSADTEPCETCDGSGEEWLRS